MVLDNYFLKSFLSPSSSHPRRVLAWQKVSCDKSPREFRVIDNRSSSRRPGTSRFGTRRFNDPRASFIGHHLSRISSTSRFFCKPISSTSTATSTISPTHQPSVRYPRSLARERARALVRVMYKVTKSDHAQRRDHPFIPVAFVTLRRRFASEQIRLPVRSFQ